MRTVQIAALKNGLSANIRHVRAGNEILVLDRKIAVAKIVPVEPDGDAEMQELVAAGILRPPKKKFDFNAFEAIGKELKGRDARAVPKAAIDRAVEWARGGVDVSSLLGRKRTRSSVRSRAKK